MIAMTDRYADAGLHYLPIERIMEDEFAPCRDGRPVLVIRDDGTADIGTWEPCQDGRYSGHDFICGGDWVTHFFPASLEPIGEHVALKIIINLHPDKLYTVQGMQNSSIAKHPPGGDIVATGVFRIPLRKPPHGEVV